MALRNRHFAFLARFHLKSGIALESKVVPKLRSAGDLNVGVEFTVSVDSQLAQNLVSELNQILEDLDISDQVNVGLE